MSVRASFFIQSSFSVYRNQIELSINYRLLAEFCNKNELSYVQKKEQNITNNH